MYVKRNKRSERTVFVIDSHRIFTQYLVTKKVVARW